MQCRIQLPLPCSAAATSIEGNTRDEHQQSRTSIGVVHASVVPSSSAGSSNVRIRYPLLVSAIEFTISYDVSHDVTITRASYAAGCPGFRHILRIADEDHRSHRGLLLKGLRCSHFVCTFYAPSCYPSHRLTGSTLRSRYLPHGQLLPRLLLIVLLAHTFRLSEVRAHTARMIRPPDSWRSPIAHILRQDLHSTTRETSQQLPRIRLRTSSSGRPRRAFDIAS